MSAAANAPVGGSMSDHSRQDPNRKALRCNFRLEKRVLHVKGDDMTKIVLLLVGSVVAFFLSDCAQEPWASTEGDTNPAPYIPPRSTESHIPGPTGPNTSIPGFP